MNALGLAELADETSLVPGGWSVLLVEEHEIEATTEELREELSFLLEDEGVGSVRVFSGGQTGPTLVEELARLEPDDVAVLPLPVDRAEEVSRSLDYGRARLVGRPRGVIVTAEASVQVLAAKAPNLWSWVSARVWRLDPGEGRLDLEARLKSLREGTGFSDAEVIARAEAGTLPPDPVFAEWLVLLGKADLLAQ